MKNIRIIIAEDHNIVRQGLINILEGYPDIYVVAEADNGVKLVDKYFETRPDVVLSDISMPQMTGLNAAKKILDIDPSAKILFLSMYDSDEYVYKCYKLGALGLITKDVIKGELINALRTVAGGERYFVGHTTEDLEIIKKRFEQIMRKSGGPKSSLLTEREKQILRFVAKGLTSEEIAQKLFLSKKTIDHHRSAIMEKLNINSLPQFIKYAVEFSNPDNNGE
ncbi:MAG: response regulator transcription factor [Ignavibacteriales bacterium]|nr:response regulator transcription factor [Ignavibacteriales bacterium]